MAGKKYTAKDHKRVYGLYKTLGSFNAVAREEDTPSVSTLLRWASADFDCPFDCQWHDWEGLEKRIRKEVRERLKDSDLESDRTDRVKSNGLERFIQSDLNRLKVNRALEQAILKKLKEGELVAPVTIYDAQVVLAKIWDQDRRILGEPTSRIEVQMSPTEWREYILAMAEQIKAEQEDEASEV